MYMSHDVHVVEVKCPTWRLWRSIMLRSSEKSVLSFLGVFTVVEKLLYARGDFMFMGLRLRSLQGLGPGHAIPITQLVA